MRPVIYEQLASVEDRLWWHESRRRLVRPLLSKMALPADSVAIDVGCGTGSSLLLLSEFASRVIGLDKSEHAIALAKNKHPEFDLRLGDANALGDCVADDSCDVITFFNVLYHAWIVDDGKVLRDACRVVKPGGYIVITDSAFRCLSRRHDRAVMGARRYRLNEMRELMRRGGFDWVSGTYFNLSCLPPTWLLARYDRLCRYDNEDVPVGEMSLPPRWINDGMKLLMDLERGWIRLLGSLPLGVSFLCVGRKPLDVPRSTRIRKDGRTEYQSVFQTPRNPKKQCDELISANRTP